MLEPGEGNHTLIVTLDKSRIEVWVVIEVEIVEEMIVMIGTVIRRDIGTGLKTMKKIGREARIGYEVMIA